MLMKLKQRLFVTLVLLVLCFSAKAQTTPTDPAVSVNIATLGTGCQGTNMTLTATATAGNTATVNGFTGIFDHANWTFGSLTYWGTVNTATPTTLSITNGIRNPDDAPSEDCIFGLTNVYGLYNQNLPAYTITCNWSYTRTNATEAYNYPGVYGASNGTGLGLSFNGHYVFAGYDMSANAPLTQSGTATFQVSNLFGFEVGGTCYNTGTGTLTITNFTATPVSTVTPTYSWTASNGGTIVSGGNTANPVVSSSGTYTVTASASGYLDGTDSEVVSFNAPVTPTFTQVPAICGSTANRVVHPLPSTSTNGISGTWSPAFNSSATTTYTFTPTAGQCASAATMTVVVAPPTTNGSVTTTVNGSYTWPLPYGTGLTYTTNQTNLTHTVGCNTATLNLTVIQPPVNTFTVGSSCGATISGLNVTIKTPAVAGAGSYLFRVTNLSGGAVQLVTRPVNSFALSTYAWARMGTDYSIEVSTNGGTTYGPACQLTTPQPITKVSAAHCGSTLSSMGQWIYADYISGVQTYFFVVHKMGTSDYYTHEAAGGLNKFNFNQLPVALRTPGTQFEIFVYVKMTNMFFITGAPCVVTTPGNSPVVTKTQLPETAFSATAYPNPFTGNFTIGLSRAGATSVQVYDMVGRLIDSKNTQESSIETGLDYPSGVYNVIVTQGEDTKALRVIKR